MSASIHLDAVEELELRSSLSVEDLNMLLSDTEALVSKAMELKEQAAEKEAVILREVLKRITPLVSILSRDYEPYYRRSVVILVNARRTQIGQSGCFFDETELILYETGSMVRSRRYGQESEDPHHPGWELREQLELTPGLAVRLFGLDSITEGLIRLLNDARERIVLKELEGRVKELAKVLEGLRCTAE
jgi:hypothetical protein